MREEDDSVAGHGDLADDRIGIDPAIMGGMPCIRGTRIPVRMILDYFAEGATLHEILQQYPQLTEEDVRAAIAFGAYAVGQWASQAQLTPTLHENPIG